VLIAVGSVAFFYTNGKGKNEETPANSYAVDTVESDDTADSHNVDAGDADTEDRNVNGRMGQRTGMSTIRMEKQRNKSSMTGG